jgi:type IV pilus assembly protein PilB
MKLQRKKKLGQLLCEKSYLDETNLEFALAEQKLEHRRLGQILLELGYITQAQLNEALALQVGIERIDLTLTDVSISNEILILVPAELVSKYNILPLRFEKRNTTNNPENNQSSTINNQLLAVAMTDPFQPQVLEDLRMVTGYPVRRYYVEPKELEKPCTG